MLHQRVFSILFLLAGLGVINALYNPHEVIDPDKMGTYRAMVGLGVFSIPLFLVSYWPATYAADYETACLMSKQLNFR